MIKLGFNTIDKGRMRSTDRFIIIQKIKVNKSENFDYTRIICMHFSFTITVQKPKRRTQTELILLLE